ncbi:tyrosine-type recombinase/integrase [Roseospira marina]|nr:tyrosine-type recombinase/integrase [Roseospira marina]MBB4315728.1 integrase [Roseospira marina]MBB5088840.1 integrase [Roseospira marina]
MTVLRLRNIHRVKTGGRVYYYHRPTRTRLPGMPGSPEFMAAYAAAEKQAAPPPKPGTLGSLIQAYRASPEYAALAAETRKDYARVLDWLGKGHDTPLPAVTPRLVFGLRDKAFEQHKRRFANYVVQVLSLLFNWGRPRGIVSGNPAEGVAKIRKPRGEAKANRPWRWEELAAALEATVSHPGIRAAIALAAFTGLRQADCLTLAWSACSDGRISVRSHKTGVSIRVPMHSMLSAVLDRTPRQSPLVVTGKGGNPYTGSGFRTELRKIMKRLEGDGATQPGLTFHGLRHTAGTMLADAGCDSRDIQAVLGLATLRMAEHYTEEADRLRRAEGAMARLELATRTRTGPGHCVKNEGRECKNHSRPSS